MANSAQLTAQRAISRFETEGGPIQLAHFAALPVALDSDLLHLIRINFFHHLLFTIESQLLLSPLCVEIGNGLYEIPPTVRELLLQKLLETESEVRVRQMAMLLWDYSSSGAWASNEQLARAQQLTALNLLAPEKAQAWLDMAREVQGGRLAESSTRDWFVAMRAEIQLQSDIVAAARTTQLRLAPRDFQSLAALHHFIETHFNLAEIQTLAFDLAIDYESLTGTSKSARVRDLVVQFERRGQLDHLKAALRQERPTFYAEQFGEQLLDQSAESQIRDPLLIFICHATPDAEFAHRLARDLERVGYKVWIAPDSIRPGEKWIGAIERGLAECGIYLLVLSPAAAKSKWVVMETNAALKQAQASQVSFLSVLLRSANFPPAWQQYQYARFNRDYEAGLIELGRSLPLLQHSSRLSPKDKIQLAQILTRYPRFLTPASRSDFLEAARLNEVVFEDLTRPSDPLAMSIISRLDNIGQMPEGDWALFRLLQYMLADKALLAFDQAAIKAVIERYRLDQPDNARALVERGKTYQQMGRYGEALADFDRALEIFPDSAEIIVERGKVFQLMGNRQAALANFDRALEIAPKSVEGLFYRGETRQLAGEYEEALVDFNRAIELDPANDGFLARRGEIYQYLGRYNEALADFDRAIELDPANDQALARRGEIYQDLGRYSEALADFGRVIELDPANDQALARRGVLYQHLGQTEKALADFGRALSLDPAAVRTLINRANTYHFIGDDQRAFYDYKRAISIEPDNVYALRNLGHLLQDMENPTEAQQYFERALAICERALGPEHPDTAISLDSLGMLLKSVGDLFQARPYLERALAIRERILGPEHFDTATSINNLGSLLYAMGDLPTAGVYLERASALGYKAFDPDYPLKMSSLSAEFARLYMLSEAADANGAGDDSVRAAVNALNLVTNNRKAFGAAVAPQLGNLGVNAEKHRQPDVANAIFELAYELDPNHVGVVQQYASFLIDNREAELDKAEALLNRLRQPPFNEDKLSRTMSLLVQLYAKQGRQVDDATVNQLLQLAAVEPSLRRIGGILTSLIRAGNVDAALNLYHQTRQRFTVRAECSELKRYLADALANQREQQYEFIAMDIYQQSLTLGEVPEREVADVKHNLATLYYKHDYDREAGVLWYDAYNRQPQDGAIRRAYSAYLLRANALDEAQAVIESKPITEMKLYQTAKTLPSRFSDFGIEPCGGSELGTTSPAQKQ